MLMKIHQLLILYLAGLLLIISIIPSDVSAQNTDTLEPEAISVTFEGLGYKDMRLQGLYNTNSLWIPFRSDWPIEGNIEMELTYIGSPLLSRKAAIITVLADNQEVASFRPIGDGLEHTLPITIPVKQQNEGVNIVFSGFLRLTDDLCEDSFNIGQWLIVRNSSQVNVNLSETPPPPQLTDLPQALTVQGDDDPPPIIFVLPEEADDLTLTAAAQVAVRLGAGITANHLPIRVSTAASFTEEDRNNANLVLIGLPDNQPLIRSLSDLMPVPPTDKGFISQDGILIPPTDGVVQIFTSPWHPRRHILLVSGNDSAGLSMAGQAFTHQATFQSLTGSFHFIHSLVDLPEPAETPPWLTHQTTFAQLGEFDRQVKGLGRIDSFFFFHYPPGVIFGEKGEVVLHLAFSPAMRTQDSYIEVYVNDIYVGSVEARVAGGDSWVSLDLPVHALNQRARKGHASELNIMLSIANLLPVNNCEQIIAENSWTKIYADSYFQIDFLPVELPDLYYFPYPFASLNNHIPVRLVVPDVPPGEELQTALSLAALIGNQTLTDLNVDVMRDTAVTPEMYKNHEFILLGSLANNSLLKEAVIEPQTGMPEELYQVLGTPQVGFFHSLASPWDKELSVLAIYGETDTGFKAAAEAFYERGRLTSELGSIALVRSGESPVIIYREAGLPQPQVVQPDIILSEISQQGNTAVEPTITAMPLAEVNPTQVVTELETTSTLTNTERLILVITAFLVILVTVATLLRIVWRIRA